MSCRGRRLCAVMGKTESDYCAGGHPQKGQKGKGVTFINHCFPAAMEHTLAVGVNAVRRVCTPGLNGGGGIAVEWEHVVDAGHFRCAAGVYLRGISGVDLGAVAGSGPAGEERAFRRGGGGVDRGRFRLLRSGGAAGATAIQSTRNAGAPNPLVRPQDLANRAAQSPPAKAGDGASRRHTGGVRGPVGPALRDFDGRLVVAPAGIEL